MIKLAGGGQGLPRYVVLLAVLSALLMAGAIFYFREELDGLKQYGYIGGFLISLISSSTVVIPVPGLALIIALSSLVAYPWLLGLAVGAGSTLGEFVGYLVGTVGRLSLQKNPSSTYIRLEGWMQRRGWLVILAFAAIPFTPFDFVGIIAGALRYTWWKFLLFCLAGKIVKGISVAYAGAWGLSHWFSF